VRLVLACLFLTACADTVAPELDEVEVSADDDGKADAATELSVRAGDTTLTVTKQLVRRGDTYVLRGKTSRTITDGRGFIFDDVYGDFAKVSPRVFELSWPVSVVRSLADGVDQFIGLSFVHSSTRPDSLTGHVVVRPRLASFTGSTQVYLTAELTPVIVAGATVYRISGHTVGANQSIRAIVDGTELASQRLDDTRFAIDLQPEQAFALKDLQIIAAFPTGGVEKHATLGLALKRLGLTTRDPEDAFPRPACTSALHACLAGLPDGALDLGACGEAVKVNACAGQIGVFVDDVAFQATLHDADTRLATPAAVADAQALAGADHADAWLFGAKETVEDQLHGVFGRWFVTATARTTVLAGALEAGLDRAYARPLELVEPHAPVPGNAAAMRQVAADAVLAELAAMDFVHTEFQRTLESLTHEFRAMHVADIQAFRTTVAPEPYPGQPDWDVYIGSWLGCHTEIAVERATGVVTQRLVEID